MRVIKFCSLGVLLSAPVASAQSVCAVALTSQAFDTVNSSTIQNIAFAKRDDLCNKTYSSLSEAQSAATSSGFNISYAGTGIGASQAKKNSEGRLKIDQSDFCKATAEAFQSAYTSTYSSQIASAALSAWTECVRITSQNQLYMSYLVHPTGDFLAGILKTTVNTGELNKQIKGITVSGPEAGSVECSILNVRLKANQALETPLRLETTDTGIACSKSGPNGASISIATSAGSLPFIELPSKDQVAAKQRMLEAQQSELQIANADLRKRLGHLESKLDATITEIADKVDNNRRDLVSKINSQFGLLNNLTANSTAKFSSLVDLERFTGPRGDRNDSTPRGQCDSRSFVYGVGKYEEDGEAKLFFYCRSWPTLSIQ